jgi:cation transport ATPase
LQTQTGKEQHYAAISTLALGLTVAGSITTFPHLVLFSIPLHIYINLPIYEEAIGTLAGKEEKRGSIILALALSSILASNHLLTANLLQWVVQRARLMGAKMQQKGYELSQIFGEGLQNWIDQAAGKKPEKIWLVRDDMEMEIPFAHMRVGDEVVFRQGEFVSVTGRVIFGEAEIFDWSLGGNMARQPADLPLHFTVGDTVTPRMMLLKGELYVRVESIA